ncbi:hypothetical protein CC85DRAFT_115293 [Cutaneotrichosporon oleaginosum]|uniref:Uncharacterized protein n=1 Tax=Cutaneotrichosporon oleaginosum TaxID=879819 RepID=A0A0J0XXC6_9TREE|nr:uncharacterized protein CC85DRAFT_115293 [Cutaneotrichosporon oleaginosum]KLT45705.1 hypothetical protein CC85DRAFT_115293 [Cutaneotrichosporon oleaginosum]TXT06194.1 hypothetical protein COLE_05525 [Cutaneotrichosporon oleaginosum]
MSLSPPPSPSHSPLISFATLAVPLPHRPPIRGITPALANHLVLQHGTEFLTLADNQTLQAVERLERHTQEITAVVEDEGSIWSAGRDALVVQWDERSQRPATEIKAFIKHALPLTALTTYSPEHLVIGGSEQQRQDAITIFWDTRNTSTPAYTQRCHSDDVTHLSILPPTATWATHSGPFPSPLLLSGGRGGEVALSDLHNASDEWGEAVVCAWMGQPVDAAGVYLWKEQMQVWARTGNTVSRRTIVDDEEGFIEFKEDKSEAWTPNEILRLPDEGPSIVHPAEEERPYPAAVRPSYLSTVLPSMGLNKDGMPVLGAGTDDGNVVLYGGWQQSAPIAFLMSGHEARGHKSAVRAMHYAAHDRALYTGSEDGVLAGWNLASLPGLSDLEDEEESEDDESEDESEIESESDESDGEDDRGAGTRGRRAYGPRW